MEDTLFSYKIFAPYLSDKLSHDDGVTIKAIHQLMDDFAMAWGDRSIEKAKTLGEVPRHDGKIVVCCAYIYSKGSGNIKPLFKKYLLLSTGIGPTEDSYWWEDGNTELVEGAINKEWDVTLVI